jgi:hypothetical protein
MLNTCFYLLYDEPEYKAFIKSVEAQFRKSPEYLIWLNNKVDRECCAATGLSKEDGIDIEVHHFQITLWNWIVIILDKFHEADPEIPVNSHYICLILSDLHISNCIPYIPLTHCIHKMLHAQGNEKIFAKYPNIVDNIYYGNTDKANEIIDYHINNLKCILEKEIETKNSEKNK